MGKEHLPIASTALILFSVAIASVVNVYPFSANVVFLRPMAMMMVLVFWLIFQPKLVGVFTAFSLGLVNDLLLETLLGQQALSAVFMAVTVKIASRYLRRLTTLSTWLLASLCLTIFQLSLWMLQLITLQQISLQNLTSLLISILSWPLLLALLQPLQAKLPPHID